MTLQQLRYIIAVSESGSLIILSRLGKEYIEQLKLYLYSAKNPGGLNQNSSCDN